MGGLLLCSSKRGTRPYLVEDGRIGIYSLDEIVYYLYHHIYMVDEEFFSEKFTEYLRQELELDYLAEKLDALRGGETSLEELVMLVLSASNYYHKEELEEFQQRLRMFSSLSAEERLKLMGDTYLRDRMLRQALKVYRAMITFYEKTVMPISFWASAFHNVGVCYLSMFFYEEAESCFMKAYGLEPDEIYLKKAALTCYLSGDEAHYEAWKNRHMDLPVEKWEGEWLKIKGSAWDRQTDKEKGTRMLYEAGRMSEFEEKMKGIFDGWKQNYRKEME